MSIRTFFPLAAAVALLLMASGCGGSDSSGVATNAGGEIAVETSSLSKAEFVKQADKICTEKKSQLLKELSAFEKEGNETSEEVRLAALAGLVIPAYEDVLGQLGSLGAPGGDEKEVDAFLNAMQQSLDKMEKDPSTLGQLTPFGKAAKLAEEYGLTGCANSLT